MKLSERLLQRFRSQWCRIYLQYFVIRQEAVSTPRMWPCGEVMCITLPAESTRRHLVDAVVEEQGG